MFELPRFQDSKWFTLAMTHSTYFHEHPEVGGSNQRLEFLGDATFKFLFSDQVFGNHPTLNEGEMTIWRSKVEQNKQMAMFAQMLNLGEHLRLGNCGKAQKLRTHTKTLADAFEALVGAYYRDSGLEATRRYLQPFFEMVR